MIHSLILNSDDLFRIGSYILLVLLISSLFNLHSFCDYLHIYLCMFHTAISGSGVSAYELNQVCLTKERCKACMSLLRGSKNVAENHFREITLHS